MKTQNKGWRQVDEDISIEQRQTEDGVKWMKSGRMKAIGSNSRQMKTVGFKG